MKKSLSEVFPSLNEANIDPKQIDQYFNEFQKLMRLLEDKIDELAEKFPELEKNKNYENINNTWLEFRKSTKILWKELKTSSPQSSENSPDINGFVKSVIDILPSVRKGGGNNNYKDKYLISDVYDKINNGMSLEEFKKNLLLAHKNGLIELVRNDLPAAMPDSNAVTKSEIKDGFSTYHFILIS